MIHNCTETKSVTTTLVFASLSKIANTIYNQTSHMTILRVHAHLRFEDGGIIGRFTSNPPETDENFNGMSGRKSWLQNITSCCPNLSVPTSQLLTHEQTTELLTSQYYY